MGDDRWRRRVRKGTRLSDPSWPPAPLPWPDAPLTDGVALLDPMRPDDAEAVITGASDPETIRFLPVPVPYSAADAQEFLDLQRRAAEAGKLLNFAIRRNGDPALVGSIGAQFAGRVGECEVGYWVTPAARGEGLAARGVRLLAGYLVRALPVHRVELLVDPANVASQRVCVAAGCTAEGLRRNASPVPRGEGWEPMLVYSLLPGDLG
jgi:RimJ/RimL family protein N-acetyltransferase